MEAKSLSTDEASMTKADSNQWPVDRQSNANPTPSWGDQETLSYRDYQSLLLGIPSHQTPSQPSCSITTLFCLAISPEWSNYPTSTYIWPLVTWRCLGSGPQLSERRLPPDSAARWNTRTSLGGDVVPVCAALQFVGGLTPSLCRRVLGSSLRGPGSGNRAVEYETENNVVAFSKYGKNYRRLSQYLFVLLY